MPESDEREWIRRHMAAEQRAEQRASARETAAVGALVGGAVTLVGNAVFAFAKAVVTWALQQLASGKPPHG